jgi:hypothetical protein
MATVLGMPLPSPNKISPFWILSVVNHLWDSRAAIDFTLFHIGKKKSKNKNKKKPNKSKILTRALHCKWEGSELLDTKL